MNRRDFFKRSFLTGLAAGSALAFGDIRKLFAAKLPPNPAGPFDLVAVKGGEPALMFDKAIESLGGMKQFVKPGQTVLVKPNIGWSVSPERAANTNPQLVKRIIQQCYTAGAKTVYVFDNTCDDWIECYETSGIKKAVEEAGGKMVPANDESHYREIQVKNGKKLKSVKVHERALDADVFINVPVLKSHGATTVSLGMKNHMGIVWDRRYWHKNDLQQCIADFAISFRKPDLTVIDGYRVLSKRGPRGVTVEDVTLTKSLILSRDCVAADAAACKVFGVEPETVPYIKMAADAGIGQLDLTKLNINRIKI